ncbi:MAG: Hsp20/alpha crystallin family protein [Verrucomicrobiota bacterium]
MYKVSSSVHFLKSSPETSDLEASGAAYWVPNTDVYTVDNGLVVVVELAGIRREDLELTIEDNRLKISGHRPDGCRSGNCKFLAMEIHYGAFENVIELPAGYDLTQARAAYQNGFLRIDVPALATPRKKRVPLDTGSKEV